MPILNNALNDASIVDENFTRVWTESLDYLAAEGPEALRQDIVRLRQNDIRTVDGMAAVVKTHMTPVNAPQPHHCRIPYGDDFFYGFETAYVLDAEKISVTFSEHTIWSLNRHHRGAHSAIWDVGTKAKPYYDEFTDFHHSMKGACTVQGKKTLDQLIQHNNMWSLDAAAPVFIGLLEADSKHPDHSKGAAIALYNNIPSPEMKFRSALYLHQSNSDAIVSLGMGRHLSAHDFTFKMNPALNQR